MKTTGTGAKTGAKDIKPIVQTPSEETVQVSILELQKKFANTKTAHVLSESGSAKSAVVIYPSGKKIPNVVIIAEDILL